MDLNHPSDHRLRQAREAFARGQMASADRICRELLAIEPKASQPRLLLSMIAVRAGRNDDGVSLLRSLLSDEPDCYEAIKGLSILLRRIGELDEAERLCRQAVRTKPGDPEAQNNLGLLLQVKGMDADAVECFQKAADLNPRLGPVYHNLGISLQNAGRLSEAAKSFEEAIKLMPGVASNYMCLGKLMLDRGHRARAVEFARQANLLEPDSTRNLRFLSRALMEAGAAQEAEVALRRALVLDPSNAGLHCQLGLLLQAEGDWPQASMSFERSISLKPDQGLAYLGLVQGQQIGPLQRDFVERVEAVLHDEQLKALDRSRLNYALGKAYDDIGDHEAAMRSYDSANQQALSDLALKREFSKQSAKERMDRILGLFSSRRTGSIAEPGNRTDLPILIVGMMRSGTTLVDRILSSHPEVGSAGEVQTWLTDGPQALDFSSGTVYSERLRAVTAEYLALLSSVAPHSTRVIDKMPANFQVLGLINLALPRAKIIHVRRNPADTCLSIYTTPYSVSPEFAHDKENIAFTYRLYKRTMDVWRDILPPGAMLEIQYEELVRDRERITRQVLAFCELDWDEACLFPERNGKMVSTPSLWQVRQPVYLSSVDRWKKYEPWLGPFKDLLR